jgi:uncharacterized protein (TIGR02001 family)
LAAITLAAARAAAGQEVVPNLSGYITLASGYWKRGLSQNDSATLNLGIDYQRPAGWFVGAWAANVEFEREFSAEQPRDVELNAYAGFHRRKQHWSWGVSLGRYAYPDVAVNYDYNELSATVGFRDRVFYTASYSDTYYGRSRAALNQELSFSYPLRGDVEIGAGLGHFAIADGGLDISYWNVGVSKLLRRLALDLRYYGNDFEGESYLGDPYADHYVLSISYALRHRGARNGR